MTHPQGAVVILGGGIIGLSIAYYIHQVQPHRNVFIIDSEDRLFQSASGSSGGLIVRDWFSPAVLSLAELSFQLHQQLADLNDGRRRWGYSSSTALSLIAEEVNLQGQKTGNVVRGEDWLLHGASRAEVAKKFSSAPKQSSTSNGHQRDFYLKEDDTPAWAVQQKGATLERISSEAGCAQVEPKELCEFLLHACAAKGVKILLGTRVKCLKKDEHGRMTGLELEKGVRRVTLPCRDIVITAGCWTPRVFETLLGQRMKIGVKPLAGYSVVVRSPRYPRHIKHLDQTGHPVDMAHSIFCPPGPQWTYSPEAMARMTRSGKPEIYVAGLNSETMKLPELAGQSKALMESDKVKDIRRTAVALAGEDVGDSLNKDDLEIVRESLCFRPVSESGVPIVSRVDGIEAAQQDGGVYVASGHGPWGITLSLGTGLVVAQLLAGMRPSDLSADISKMALGQDVSRPISRL